MANIQTYVPEALSNEVTARSTITDWYSLGALLNIPVYKLSYAQKHRHELQKKITIKGRTVYDSQQPLKGIQYALVPLLTRLQEDIPTEHILSYKKNFDFIPEIKNKADSSLMIHFDIRGFFDHITFKHITTSLHKLGFSNKGAIQLAKFTVADTPCGSTLQQGSPCSPLISNIVGYHLIDEHLLRWIAQVNNEYPLSTVEYARYCDNIVVFVKGKIPKNFSVLYKQEVSKTLNKSAISAHKWATIKQEHPLKNMQFLGIILNKAARIDRTSYEKLRAVLFNVATKNMHEEITKYISSVGDFDQAVPFQLYYDKFMSIFRGKVNYVHRINLRQGSELKKLLGAIEKRFSSNGAGVMSSSVFNSIKRYTKHNESLAEYVTNILI